MNALTLTDTSSQTRQTPDEDVRPALISVKGVSKRYPKNRRDVLALSGVTADVREREFVTVVGPTGCGKTTLLRIIAGLLAPTRGHVSIGGRIVQGPSRAVALTFQRPVLLPWRTVAQNLTLPAELTDTDGRGVLAGRIEGLLRLTGLDAHRHAYPREISPGMQQVVSFCMALVLDPDVLLMDEPFGALDALTRERLGESLLDVWGAFRKTMVFVTHSIAEAVFLGDRVLVMSSSPGRIIASIPIALPRPRRLHSMWGTELHALTTLVRTALEEGMRTDG